MLKKILFITSTNLASNPRLEKELSLALEMDLEIAVVQFKLNNWSDEETQIIELKYKESSKCKFYCIEAIPNNRINYLKLGLLEKLSKFIYPFFKKNLYINALGHSRRSIQIKNLLSTLSISPEVIVAHNLPSLYPAYRYSIENRIPFIFDNEDYHPGELIRLDVRNEVSRREFLLKHILPSAYSLISASPLIAKKVNSLIGGHKNHTVILNGFREDQFMTDNSKSQKETSKEIGIIWFSQNITKGRGLEEFFNGLLKVEDRLTCKLRVCLIGHLHSLFYEKFLEPKIAKLDINKTTVEILPPLSQEKLHKKLANFDVGLALEIYHGNLNRNICLSNKIVAYAQSGLYILATDTLGQSNFINNNPSLGSLVDQSAEGISDGILSICKRKDQIFEQRIKRFNLAKQFSWDSEKEKVKNIWRTIE